MSRPFPVTSEGIDHRLGELYGAVDWDAARGVVQVAAIAGSERVVIVPGADAPTSETDRFILAVARARADAIVTTGAILRSEPELRHDPSPNPAENLALLGWRHERLRRAPKPLIVLLSASADLPVEHPAIRAAADGFLWTSREGAKRLRRRVGERLGNLELLEGDPDIAGIVGAIRVLRRTPGIDTILVEAGPSASAPLYPEPLQRTSEVGCDELLLSRFEGGLTGSAVGPAFLSSTAIESRFATPPHETQIEDSSGRWTILRYRMDQPPVP